MLIIATVKPDSWNRCVVERVILVVPNQQKCFANMTQMDSRKLDIPAIVLGSAYIQML